LQALFWVSEKGDVEALNSIVIDYTLRRLLERAWTFETIVFKSKGEVLEIIGGINSEDEKKMSLNDLEGGDLVKMQRFLFIDYKRNPKMFSSRALAGYGDNSLFFTRMGFGFIRVEMRVGDAHRMISI